VSAHSSIRPFVRTYQRLPTGRIYLKFDNGDFPQKSVEKIRIWLRSSQNFGRFMKTRVCFIVADDINDSISILFEMVSGSWDSRGGVNITYVDSLQCYVIRTLRTLFYHAYFLTHTRELYNRIRNITACNVIPDLWLHRYL